MNFSMSVPASDDDVVSRHLTACADIICKYGRCVLVDGKASCECKLGYVGDTCDETINDALSVPLTLGILAFIIGFIILFFGMAFFRQRQKAKMRKKAAEEALLRNGAHL
ncbi:meprin A subunit beta-like [Cyprinus carpio]|uniref:Meprin A subunit beta-like n=1 Tax=Cyprinus carpio TaxID=7962 RepID=A0A9Q9WR97_CYPCA|nr:meprin A subunit beta-like [Cyprinus carpio]